VNSQRVPSEKSPSITKSEIFQPLVALRLFVCIPSKDIFLTLCRFLSAKPGGAEDESFCYATEDASKPQNWQLRESVLAKLSELQDLCHDSLRPLVDIIPSLLTPMPKERPTAAKLVETLECLDPDMSSSRGRGYSAVQSESNLDSIRRASTLLTVPVPRPRRLPTVDEMDLDENQFIVVDHPAENKDI
jgi:hypothetical protein